MGNIDLHAEHPLPEVPAEQRTPEVRAQYEKFFEGQLAADAPPGTGDPVGQPYVTYDQFKAIEFLVGRIIAATPVPKTDKLVHMVVDLGSTRGTVDVVAGILKSFPDPTVLLGKTYAFVTNLPPRTMKGIQSKGMLLCAVEGEKVTPVEVPGAEPGARLS